MGYTDKQLQQEYTGVVMPISFRWFLGLGLVALLLGVSASAEAQDWNNMKFRSGQNVQPVFEGWSINDDGSFTMHFGYLNRNWIEEVHVPIGPDNRFEGSDGAVDVGQPTFFYPRAHRRVFSVTVPSSFGTDERLNWLLTVRGETMQASGWLQPEWETSPDDQGRRAASAEQLRNTAPTVTLDVPSSATAQSTVTLSARVADDGLPTIREVEDRAGSNDPPTFVKPEGELDAPRNVTGMPNNKRAGQSGSGIDGLRMSWILWRGPAGVLFEPASTIAVENEQADVTATFTTPGEYVLRYEANDGPERGGLTVSGDVPVTVR